MSVDYNHSQNLHTLEGPKAALPMLFPEGLPKSIMDVGCGTGTWLRAAMDLGATDVFGIDGVNIPANQLLIEPQRFQRCDLTAPIDLNRRFDAVFCLEVAEHLDAQHAVELIQTLTRHSDLIFFSAACPGQDGQHHVNCQWPIYWQQLFNESGYVCEDAVRWQIWDDRRIEPWYRQNMFLARRDASLARREPRIKAVLHPEMLSSITPEGDRFGNHVRQIENGRMRLTWYLKTPVRACFEKLKRHLT